jgi:dTDP-4-dehydrorhamnose reductase
MLKVLIIGGSGFVGARLAQGAAKAGFDVTSTHHRHEPDWDLFTLPLSLHSPDDNTLEQYIEMILPDIVIHAAVPKASSPENQHKVISVDSVRRLLTIMPENTRLIYLSTNVVFASEGCHTEIDETDAHKRQDIYRAYGMYRAEGEQLALQWKKALVIRTDTVNGRDYQGQFNSRMTSLIDQFHVEKPFARFIDRYITPTAIDNLVDTLIELMHPKFSNYQGILHIAGCERITDYDYARLLAEHLQLNVDLVQEGKRGDHPATAHFPSEITLNTSRAQSLLETRLLDIRQQFAVMFGTL